MNLERRRVRTHPFTTPAIGFFRPVRLFTTPRIWPAQKVQIYGTAFFLCCGIEHRQLHGRIGGSVGMRLGRLGPPNDQQVEPWQPCFSKSVRFFTLTCSKVRASLEKPRAVSFSKSMKLCCQNPTWDRKACFSLLPRICVGPKSTI